MTLSLATLFLASLLAATVLPFYSEAVLLTLQAAGHDRVVLWAVATTGNTLGAALNWILGRWLLRFRERPWFPFRGDQLGRSQRWFQRYGVWSLLLAWMPVVGDALTFIAGVMRVSFPLFLVLTAIGKGVRYAVVIAMADLAVSALRG